MKRPVINTVSTSPDCTVTITKSAALFRDALARGVVEFHRQLDAEWEALPEVIEHNGLIFHKDLLR